MACMRRYFQGKIACVLTTQGERTAVAADCLLRRCPSVHMLSVEECPSEQWHHHRVQAWEEGFQWLLHVEGNILVYPEQMEAFFKELLRLPSWRQRGEVLLLDKLTGNMTTKGLIAVRTQQHDDAMAWTSAYICSRLAGVRNFEQHYGHVAMEALRMAASHENMRALREFWCAGAQWDEDFVAALLGTRAASASFHTGADTTPEAVLQSLLNEYGLLKKITLCGQAWTEAQVFRLILDALQDEHRHLMQTYYKPLLKPAFAEASAVAIA